MRELSLEEIITEDINDFKNCPDNHACESCEKATCVKVVAIAAFPSKFGDFKIVGFVNNKDRKEHIAIVKGDVLNKENVLTRVHSSCLTGDALGSMRCDCGPQLTQALIKIEDEGTGIILYMQQEGRGIGLLNKLRAYALQDEGYDTWDANVVLGFDPDLRKYEVAGEMLSKIGIRSIRLMTNNPEKIKQLEPFIKITERVPIELPTSDFNRIYMETKKERFGHFLTVHTNK